MLNRMEMVRIFCTAAEAGSFREAATRLGISPQGVTRAIQALETELGESLFHRNTRQVSITAFGQDYAKDARSALDHFDTLFRSHRTEPELSGRVGITAPHAIGRRFLIPFLQPLAAAHPDLQFDLRLEDQMTDAVEAHIDIGIRVGVIRDRRYVARALAPVPFYVVACPSLIGQKTPPKSLDALAKLPLSVLIDRKNGRPWPWLFADGQTFAPRQPALICDDPDTECKPPWQACVLAKFLPIWLSLICGQESWLPFWLITLQHHGICSYTARSRVLYRSGCDWCTTTLSRLSQTPSYFPRAWGHSLNTCQQSSAFGRFC